MAQLSINRFPLPSELHSIIKDFALLTPEQKRIMQLHKKIHSELFGPLWWMDEYLCTRCGNFNIYVCKNAFCKC